LRIQLAILLALSFQSLASAQNSQTPAPPIQNETLAQTNSSWDGAPYTAYPSGQPQLSVLKVTIPANTTMKWHTHPIPNAAYVLSGEITVETKDGTKHQFTVGQVIPETVNTIHRGVTGADPAVLIVFYAGTASLPLSKPAPSVSSEVDK
jgi:quercetin dioxygenase-like cupin family protein